MKEIYSVDSGFFKKSRIEHFNGVYIYNLRQTKEQIEHIKKHESALRRQISQGIRGDWLISYTRKSIEFYTKNFDDIETFKDIFNTFAENINSNGTDKQTNQ